MFFKPGIREFDQRLILHYRNSSRSTSNSRMRYSAPLFNRISLDVFSRSLCLRSLTESDFVGGAAGTDGVNGVAEPIFADGFESTNGSGVLTDLCN